MIFFSAHPRGCPAHGGDVYSGYIMGAGHPSSEPVLPHML